MSTSLRRYTTHWLSLDARNVVHITNTRTGFSCCGLAGLFLTRRMDEPPPSCLPCIAMFDNMIATIPAGVIPIAYIDASGRQVGEARSSWRLLTENDGGY